MITQRQAMSLKMAGVSEPPLFAIFVNLIFKMLQDGVVSDSQSSCLCLPCAITGMPGLFCFYFW